MTRRAARRKHTQRALNVSPLRAVDWESLSIRFEITLRIKLHAVEHFPARIVLRAIRHADFFHGFGGDVAPFADR